MLGQNYSLELYASLNTYPKRATADKMKPGEELYSIARLYFLASLLTLGSADYVHRHDHSIQMKNYEHPWFGNNSIRFCAFNQYLDEHEGRCMIIPGGGTAISIDDKTTCEVEALRPHPSLPSSYYACRKTKTILAECRSGQRFENRLKRCAIDVNFSEDDFSGDDDSPEAYNHIHLPACERPGRYPVPHGNCTIFYACTSNGFRLFRTIYRCPPLTGFDPFTKMCSPEFACDNLSESDPQLPTIKPEQESTTFDPRNTEITTTTQTSTTIAPTTIDLQEISLDTPTPFSFSEKSTTSNYGSWDNFDYDSTTEIIKTSTTTKYNEVETTSVAPPLDFTTESKYLTTTDEIVGADQFLTTSTTQDYGKEETTSTYEAAFTTENPGDAATTTAETVSTFTSPTIDWQETSSLDTSTPFSVSEESITSNFGPWNDLDYDSTTEMIKTSTNTEFNEVETTSVAPPLDLTTESEFLTTTDNIVGENLFSTISSTQDYENQETTPTSEATSTEKEVQTSEDPSIDESSSLEEISTLDSIRNDQESTTIGPEISTVEETTLSNNSGEDEETTIGYFTTIEPETEETTSSYLYEKTSQTDRIITTEKWLFDFSPTDVSTTMESSDSPDVEDILFTTASTLLTATELIPTTESNIIGATNIPGDLSTSLLPEKEAGISSGETLLDDPSTTIAEAETTSLLEESTADSVTPPTLEGKWLYDVTRADESSEMLLTTTEIPATSAIEDDVTPTTVVNDYANDGDFLQSESSTENSSFNKYANDEEIVDITTVIPQTSGSESSPIVHQSLKNLVTLMTPPYEVELGKIESTTENSWSSISDAGSVDGFSTTPDPLESILTSNESIEYDETTDNYNDTTVLPVSKSDDETTSLPDNDLDTDQFNDPSTIMPEAEQDTVEFHEQTTISPEEKQNTDEFNEQTTIVPENELNTDEFNNQTTILPQTELETSEINDESTISSEDELETSEINGETTISSEDELETSKMNDETTMLTENEFTTRPDDGASELPEGDFRISTDTVPEILSTSSYNSTPSAESTISTTEATELSSEVTDDVSTDTESSYSSILPTMDSETDTTEATYSTSEKPNETETYSDVTSNVQSTTDSSLLFSTSEGPVISDD